MRAHVRLAPLLLWISLAACSHKEGDDIALKEVRDDAFGYTIRMPVGATQTENGKGRHVWSWSPDQHVNSYSCIIQPESLATFDPETAKKDIALIRKADDIKSAVAQGSDGLVVELAEDPVVHYRETWCFRRGKTATLVAICTGPAKGNTVTAMATSLTATK